jgi:putative phage-type endonuclease
MEQKIDFNSNKPNFYSNKKKINRIKKMDKKIILQIQQIIQDIVLNTEITNSELEIQESRNEIKFLVLEILRELIDKKNDFQIISEYEKEIERHLLLSIKVNQPIYNEEEISILNKIIVDLKKIPQPEQRTPEWYAFRKDRLTASDLGTIIGVNPYEQADYVVQKKCGFEKPFKVNRAIKWGIKYEEVITMVYQQRNEVKVFEYGCLPHQKIGHFGASPDGIVDSDSINKDYIGRMLEIKCPTSRDITGFIPEYYHAQVQGQLEVCDLEYCDFVECKISEYASGEEYWADGDNYYQDNGFEKGVVIDTYDLKLKKEVFYYAKLGSTKEEIDKWEDEIIDKIVETEHLDYIKTSYWKVTQYNELLIKRDKEWFDGVCLPKINEFWAKVLEYRQRPLEDVKALCSSRNSKSKKIVDLNEKPKLNEVQYSKDKSLITNYLDKKEEKPTNEFLFLSDSD